MNGPGAHGAAAAIAAAATAAVALASAPACAGAQEEAAGDTLPGRDTLPAARADTAAGPPGPGAAQSGSGAHAFLGGYALLAYDASTGQIGAAAATSGFSAGSGTLAVEAGRGAVAVLGNPSPPARRAAAAALRDRAGAGEAATRGASAAGRPPGLQVSVLTTDCARGTRTAEDAYPWTGVVEGSDRSVCFLAAGAFLADSAVVARLAGAFRAADGGLLDRMQAALSAAEDAAGEVARSRSAAVWISAPDAGSGALGRADLRLQVEDVQRPADALRYLVRAGRAEHLAERASRAVDAGDYERALEVADRAVEQDPATALAWMARGRALLYLSRDEDAEAAFQRMLEVNPHLLHLLGDPSGAARDTADGGARGAPDVRRELIPYRPRLVLRLDEYRRAFYRQADFPSREGGEDGATDDAGGPRE